ncbi:MAG: GatB/YqeY domain-containing protein [Parvularculaceae bacterium]|nr:GatB/YqeY domain-containing protein [Parvularculaceae bacterium]
MQKNANRRQTLRKAFEAVNKPAEQTQVAICQAIQGLGGRSTKQAWREGKTAKGPGEGKVLRGRVEEALIGAMKARDEKTRVSTLRLITAAIKDRDIAARAEDRCCGVSDDEILQILTKMVKQREDSASAYERGSRLDLAEQERAEIEIIKEFLPRQLSEAEISSLVSNVIAEMQATGLKDMGKCMGALKERHSGAMDFGRAGALMKKALE